MDGSGGPSDDSEATVPLRGVANALIAVCAVFAVIGVLLAAFGEPVGKAPPPGAGRSPASGGAATSKPPQPPHPAPGTTTAPHRTDPATTSPPSRPTTAPPPTTRPPAPHRRPVAKGHVVVFNETVHRGLAARFAAQLQSEGWTVDGIGTWRGNVPATTVYYPPGLEPKARTLMAEHPEVGRIRPAFPGISRTAVTVILAKDFPVGSLSVPDVGDDAFPQVIPGTGTVAK